MFRGTKVAAIVPAYNEIQTAFGIVYRLLWHPKVNEVIFVDDGSNDGTYEKIVSILETNIGVLKSLKIIKLEKNSGKTAAIQAGFEKTETPFILLLDADLKELKAEHIDTLVDPVLRDEVDMTIGLFRGGRFITDLAHRTNPNLSGQRAMRRECLEKVNWQKIKDFGLESHLTDLVRRYNWKIKWVELHGMTHRMKTEKRGFWQGWKARLKMWRQIIFYDWLRETGWSRVFKQRKKE